MSTPNPRARGPPVTPVRAGSAPLELSTPPPRQAAAPQVLSPVVLRQQQAVGRYQEEVASIVRSRDFRDLRFRLNNYFEYNRRGLVPEYENLGQQPWDDALTDPTKALAPYDRQARPDDWDSIYNDRFGNDDEAVRAQQASNMAPFEAPAAGFVRPKDDMGGRHNMFRNTKHRLVRSDLA